jgi:hypothetical protein
MKPISMTEATKAPLVAARSLPPPLKAIQADNSRRRVQQDAARTLHVGAGVLALTVLTDSGIEHYRGSFQNRAMVAPLVSASAALAAAVASALRTGVIPVRLGRAYKLAEATGLAGLAFHLYNILKRPGGLSWENLFYAAPVGAPAALTFAGFFGDCALRVQRAGDAPATLFGQPAGRVLAAAASVGLMGTAGEASLMHFRGAYHNPAMFLPMSLPPPSACLLAATAAAPKRIPREPVRGSLRLTAALGLAGVGLHAFGVWRNMGGWRNWSQNVLNGPPLPAPPSFLGIALVGLAALALMEADDE